MLHLLASNQILPRVDRIFALKDYAKAFALFESNQGQGQGTHADFKSQIVLRNVVPAKRGTFSKYESVI